MQSSEPPEISGNHSPYPGAGSFAELIAWHLEFGTRPRGSPNRRGVPWSAKEFAGAIGSVDERTVRYWRAGKKPQDFRGIERALFGDNVSYEQWRSDLRVAYARHSPPQSSIEQGINPASDSKLYDAREQWKVLGSRGNFSLVELRLHPPRIANESSAFYLDATLHAGVAEYEFENEPVFIGIRRAVLSIESDSFQPVKGSMLGERQASPNFNRISGGVQITGPQDDQGRMMGDILNDEHIAIVEPVGNGVGPLVVRVAVPRRGFLLNFDLEPENQTVNKEAILDILIFKTLEKDGQGRGIIAESSIQRTVHNED